MDILLVRILRVKCKSEQNATLRENKDKREAQTADSQNIL
jgi:hypothetical protein